MGEAHEVLFIHLLGVLASVGLSSLLSPGVREISDSHLAGTVMLGMLMMVSLVLGGS